MHGTDAALLSPAPTAMPVRSVRLPEHLWRRLEAARDRVNEGRAGPVGLSSVIRGLLEQALASGEPLDFDARTFRPARVRRERAARLTRSRALEEAPAVFRAASELLEQHAITPPLFAKAIGGERAAAQRFFHSGRLPEQDPEDFLERVKGWIKATEGR